MLTNLSKVREPDDVFVLASTDGVPAYSHFIGIWNEFASMAPADFAIFTNTTDTTSVILQAHFLAIEALLKPWLVTELDGQVERNGYSALPSSATLGGPSNELVRWPLRILEEQRKRLKKQR